MFYLATALILVGLVLILVYIFGDAGRGQAASPAASQEAAAATQAKEVGLPGPRPSTGEPREHFSGPGSTEAGRLKARHVHVDTLAAAVRGAAAVREPQGPPPLAIQGILFLKPDRGMPEGSELFGEGERVLGGVRRVGEATLFVESGRFLIRAGDASFSYSGNDLEEVVFEQGGFSFIPVDRGRPVPVFLSERPDELREYLRKHSAAGAR